MRERDERLIGIAHRCDVDFAGAYEDEIGALAGGQRSRAIGDAKIGRAIDRCKTHQAPEVERNTLSDAMRVQTIENSHAL